MRSQLQPGQILAVPERALDDSGSASQHAGVQPELPVVGGHGSLHLGRGELQHPADVGWSDEVPGGTEQVGPENGAPVNRPGDGFVGHPWRHAQAERPFGRPVFLGLHGA
jgi:hypothetical protein